MRRSWKIAVTILLVVGITSGAWARRHAHSSDAVAGEFDYYLLALSWSPAFCLGSPSAAQCNGPRRYGFVVHGLWPQYERGWPESCADTRVPGEVVEGVLDLMPARSLVYHEWSAHGTCSGLAPAEFFALVRRAYETIAIPPNLSRPNGAIEQPPASIVAEFLRTNPRLPPQSVVATCSGQGAPRLREVHLCFSRDLTPRSCSADALREACRAPSVIVPPIR